MKAVLVRYLNEIVSLTVLALMSVALIDGQVESIAHKSVNEWQQEMAPALIREILETRLQRKDQDDYPNFRHTGE